jgi:hypothetical protein
MELFRKNREVWSLVVIENGVTLAYLDYNMIFIQKQLMGNESLIKENPGKCTCITESTHCFIKAILCSGNNDGNHISDEALNRQIICFQTGTELVHTDIFYAHVLKRK